MKEETLKMYNNKIVNVSSTHTTTASTQLSRYDLLSWINNTLKSKFEKVDELCTGAAYCQMMHSLYPKAVPIKRVKFYTNLEHEFIDNFKILQTVFQKLNVQKSVPIDRLVRGKFQDNIEFLQWFKTFYDANYDGTDYEPVSARYGQPMGYGTAILKKKSKLCSPRRDLQCIGRTESTTKNSDNEEIYTLKRSLTRTELRHDVVSNMESFNRPEISEAPISKLPIKSNKFCQASLGQMQRTQNKMHLQLESMEIGFRKLSAELKLEQILKHCEDAKMNGRETIEIGEIIKIILAKTDKTENELDPLCAGDHAELNDVNEII